MFGKKSNLTAQIAMKDGLLKDINIVLHNLEKGKFSSQLDTAEVKRIVSEIRVEYSRLENSIGDGKCDISNGCAKIKRDLSGLMKAASGNLIGRFRTCSDELICDISEIVDLENGTIDRIEKEEDNSTKQQKLMKRKLDELNEIQIEFKKNCARVEQDIRSIERDKDELDEKLLSETNVRIKKATFNQIQATIKKIDILNVKQSQYSACESLLDEIKTYANELVMSGGLSSSELDKAKIVLNIGRLRDVLDDPAKLQPLLKIIDNDLKTAIKNTVTVENGLGGSLQSGDGDYDEMNKYINKIVERKTEKQDIVESVADLTSLSGKERRE